MAPSPMVRSRSTRSSSDDWSASCARSRTPSAGRWRHCRAAECVTSERHPCRWGSTAHVLVKVLMTLRALRFSLVVAALAAPLPLPLPALAAQSVDATLDRASAAWAKVKTVRATFEQTVTNSLTGSTASARGEFQQQRPHRLAVRFTDPPGDRIVADGKSVWIYLPSSVPGQVVKRTATDAAATPVDLTGQFLDDPHAKYVVSDGGSSTV